MSTVTAEKLGLLSLSFKKRIIIRIVLSIKYFIKRRDIKRVEAGLVTLLSLIGFISSDFIGVFFSYLRLKYPSNYTAIAAYINNLRPKSPQYFDNYLFDYELLLCALKQNNPKAIDQLLLRLELVSSSQSLTLVRCMSCIGIHDLITPRSNLRSFLTFDFVSSYRMAAEVVYSENIISQRILKGQFQRAISSHPDLHFRDLKQQIHFNNIDIDDLQEIILLPGFYNKFSVLLTDVLTLRNRNILPSTVNHHNLIISILFRIFYSQTASDLNKSYKDSFDAALFYRLSLTTNSKSNSNTQNHPISFSFSLDSVPLFHNSTDPVIKSISALLK